MSHPVAGGQRIGRRVIGWLLVVAGMLGAIGVGVTWVAPYDSHARVAAQVRHLSTLGGATALQMQEYFPEGEFFTYLLPGLAAGELAREASDTAVRRAYLDVVERDLAAITTDAVRARFGSIPALAGGIFYRGWVLLLESYLATLDDGSGRQPGYLAQATSDAQAIVQAVDASVGGFVASYPGQYWPCDTVVALAAVRRLGVAAPGTDSWDPTSWLATIDASRDRATGLLAHQVLADGAPRGGPRGSSQTIIQAFWPLLTDDRTDWSRFRDLFVVNEAGFVGVREYPVGSTGQPDVDSGPLILGISLSASAVGLAAARANGDAALAETLDREAESFGFPWDWNGERWYAFGQLPVGDAFLVWARSVPVGSPAPSTSPSAWWPLLTTPWLVLVGMGGFVLRGGATVRPRLTQPGH